MTSNESLIYGKLLTEHPSFIKPITELSYNEAQAHNFIMSNEMGFDFDMVHNCSPCYSKVRNEKSPDAIFLNEDTLYFIEFKDGKNVDKHDIRLKIHEAALTLFMLAKKHLPTITRDDFFKLK
ncbi:TPA: hypothetical protein I8624_002723, partial [Serratia marcescens]|nr:hypothetical protein [Serratia marcescens]